MSSEVRRVGRRENMLLAALLCVGCAAHQAPPSAPPQVLGSAGPAPQVLGSAAPGPTPGTAQASGLPSSVPPQVVLSTPALEHAVKAEHHHLLGIAQMRALNAPQHEIEARRQAVISAVQAATEWKVGRPIVEARVNRAIRETRLPSSMQRAIPGMKASAALSQRFLEGSPQLQVEIEREHEAIERAGTLQRSRETQRESEQLIREIVQRIHGRVGGPASAVQYQVQKAVVKSNMTGSLGADRHFLSNMAEHAEGPMRELLSGKKVNLDGLEAAYRAGYAGQPAEATQVFRAEFERTQRVFALAPWEQLKTGDPSSPDFNISLIFLTDSVLTLAQQNPSDAALMQLGYEMVLYGRTRDAEAERRVSAALAEANTAAAQSARADFQKVRSAIARLELRRMSGAPLSLREQRWLEGLKKDERQVAAKLTELAALGRTKDKPFALPGATERLRASIGAGKALLSFVEYRHASAENLNDPSVWPRWLGAFVLTPGGLSFTPLAQASALETQINAYLTLIGTRTAQLAEKRAAAEALHRAIIVPIADALRGSEELTVVGDGALQLLPLEALHDGRGWLADAWRISYAASERQLGGEYEPSVVAGPPLIAAAGPYSNDPAPFVAGQPLTPQHFGPLAGARAEVADVQKILPGAEALFDAQTTDALLRRKPARMLHIAAHGVFLPIGQDGGADDRGLVLRQPESVVTPPQPVVAPLREEDEASRMARSTLVLTPGGEDDDDGFLTAYEVASADLWGTELVVLSACETGRGLPDRARGVQGLRRAFFTAGANSLVMSLWSVDDRATHVLMQDFYAQLAAGQGRREALAHASKLVRAQHPDPYYWAPFILLGNKGPLGARAGSAPAVAEGEDDESRFRRAMQAKHMKRTWTRIGTATLALGGTSHPVVDTHLVRKAEAGKLLQMTLLAKQTSLSIEVPQYRGVGRYVIGNNARASSLPVTDALAVDITKLARDRARVDAASGTLEVQKDDVQEGFVGTISVKLRDGRTVTGEFSLDAQLAQPFDFLRPK